MGDTGLVRLERGIYQAPSGQFRVRVRGRYTPAETIGEARETRDRLKARAPDQREMTRQMSIDEQRDQDDPMAEARAALQTSLEALEPERDEIRGQIAELQVGLSALDQRAERIENALGALNGSGRRPYTPPSVPSSSGRGNRKAFLPRDVYDRLEEAIYRAMSTETGEPRSFLFDKVEPDFAGHDVRPDHVSRVLTKLLEAGRARREMPGGNPAHTVWFRVEPEGDEGDEGEDE